MLQSSNLLYTYIVYHGQCFSLANSTGQQDSRNDSLIVNHQNSPVLSYTLHSILVLVGCTRHSHVS